MHWTEASSLVCLDFRKSNFYPSKLDLRISGLVLLVFWYTGTFGFLVLCEKYGFTFWEIYPLKKCAEDAKMFLDIGLTFLDGFEAGNLL
jgi:hypothetical protein